MSTVPFEVTQSAATDRADRTFVGRRRDIGALQASLDAVVLGSGRLDIVSGPAGIGKTRLTHEVAALARERGFYVLRGGCWEGEGAPAYWPWADVLRTHLGTEPGSPGAPADFSQLLELAATQAAVPVRAVVDPSKDAQQARFMLFDRFCELLAVVARPQPLLVIVDDVQFADTGSLLLLQFLASRLSNVPIALLVTSRDPLSELTASTARHPWARHRVLQGLNRTEARTLLAAYVPGSPRRAALDRLMHLTEGNPFFVKELGHLLAHGKRVLDSDEPVPWPASLLAVTLQPYHRLSPACRALLQAASVVGREFEADVTAQAAQLPASEALVLLDEAIQHRVVSPAGPARYHFVHALVREAILSQLHPSQRIGLHAHIAVALENLALEGEPIPAAVLAHHFSSALPSTTRRRAAQYSIAAGDAAHTAFAYEDAVTQFRRAQAFSGAALTEHESCNTLLRLGAAEAGAGQWAQSRRTFEDAAATARRINSPQHLARAALGFKGMMWGTNPVDSEAVTLLEEARQRLEDSSPSLHVELLSALSRSLYFATNDRRAHHYGSEALTLAYRLDDKHLIANAIETNAVSLLRPGKALQLLESSAALSDLGDDLHDPQFRFNARMLRQFALLTVGRIREADEELECATRISDSAPYPRFRWQLALIRVARATLRGDLASAERLSLAAQELGKKVHDASPMQYQLLQSFHRAQLRDDVASWATLFESALPQLPHIPAVRVAHAWILARTSHTELAIESLHALATDRFCCIPDDHLTLYYLCVLADVAAALHQRQHARTLYDLLLPYTTDYVVTAWGSLIDGSTAHYLGLAAAASDMPEVAQVHFEQAIDANRRIDAPALTARSTLQLARLLADFGGSAEIESARELFRHSAGTFASLGLDAQARAADAAHRRLTHSVTPLSEPATRFQEEAYVFRRVGDVWSISFEGEAGLLRATVGLQYISVLLACPKTAFHVLDLIGASHHSPPAEHSGSMSDTAARAAYKRRLTELSSEIEEAEAYNDLGRCQRLAAERDCILQELSHSFGMSGAPRSATSGTEKARISVRNRITSTLKAINRISPSCATFLRRSLQTGTFCVYDPIRKVSWIL